MAGQQHGSFKAHGRRWRYMNYLFYEEDPGVAVPDVRDVTYQANTEGVIPEFHWIDWDIDDFFSGKVI